MVATQSTWTHRYNQFDTHVHNLFEKPVLTGLKVKPYMYVHVHVCEFFSYLLLNYFRALSLVYFQRRCKALAEKGLLFVGSGVSGGEDGARYGPSLMPGGSPAAWPSIQPIFQSICAKADGEPCCDWVSHT